MTFRHYSLVANLITKYRSIVWQGHSSGLTLTLLEVADKRRHAATGINDADESELHTQAKEPLLSSRSGKWPC
jgi:hypothetical protein